MIWTLGVGITLLISAPNAEAGGSAHGFGSDGKPYFWIGDNQRVGHGDGGMSPSPPERDARGRCLPRAGDAAGGRDHGAPGLRPHYHPNYYGAFVLDPDGNNIEAVCHKDLQHDREANLHHRL